MKKGILILLIILLTVSVSCNSPEVDPEPEMTAPPSVVEPATSSPALATVPSSPVDTPLPDDYPAPTPYPTVTVNAAYPAIATLPPKYPAGEAEVRVWMLRPLGIQCSDPSTFLYATLADAVDALEEAEIEVVEAEMISLGVTESCDSPTSEHFRVLINASNLDAAIALGWSPEP